MRQSAKMIIFSVAIFLISLTSCKPRKAIEFKESIVQKERVAFNILLDKNGSESQKLNCLIKDDYKGALASVDKQEKEFNKLISDIDTLPADGIKQGPELKTAALNYYVALKELHVFDRAEIAQREITHNTKGEALQTAHNKIRELGIHKQDMFRKVYEKESALSQALEKFNTVNNI